MPTFAVRVVLTATLMVFCLSASAKLPPPTDAAKAQAAEASAKAAWTDKVGLYKTCLVMERVASAYRDSLKREGKDSPAPTPTPACSDPGPYTPVTSAASKPLETSEAHSPTGTAASPPSTNTPAATAQGTK